MFALMSNNNDRNKWVRQTMAFATASCVYSDAADIWLILTYSLDKITSKKDIHLPVLSIKSIYMYNLVDQDDNVIDANVWNIWQTTYYSKYSDHVFEQLHCQPSYAFGYTRIYHCTHFSKKIREVSADKSNSYFANVILKTWQKLRSQNFIRKYLIMDNKL